MSNVCAPSCAPTFAVYEDVAIKSVSKQKDIFSVFEIDISPGEQVRVETAETNEEAFH